MIASLPLRSHKKVCKSTPVLLCQTAKALRNPIRVLTTAAELKEGEHGVGFLRPDSCETAQAKAEEYDKSILKGTSLDAETYYNTMAKDFDSVMGLWGWQAPQVVAAAVSKCISDGNLSSRVDMKTPLRILDCGCGSGLNSKALSTILSSNLNYTITGIDISSGMLAQAKKSNVFTKLVKADINKSDLPFEDNFFDVLTCVGTTTYLKPKTILKWIRVTKVGGIISFNVKSSDWSDWEEMQDKVVEEGMWEQLWVSDEKAHVQNSKSHEHELHKTYIYRKIRKLIN